LVAGEDELVVVGDAVGLVELKDEIGRVRMGDRAREDRGLDRARFAVGDGEVLGVVERHVGEK
jgi:hypothetical protein